MTTSRTELRAVIFWWLSHGKVLPKFCETASLVVRVVSRQVVVKSNLVETSSDLSKTRPSGIGENFQLVFNINHFGSNLHNAC